MILTQIVAISENFVIGKDNKLLWHFPEDLKYFKAQTLNKIIIMGRKTFESFGGKTLPKRFHIVISRTATPTSFENGLFVRSIEEALSAARTQIQDHQFPEDVMIIGGAEIYQQTLSYCDKLLITRIKNTYDGDTYYPRQFVGLFKLDSQIQSETSDQLSYETWLKIK